MTDQKPVELVVRPPRGGRSKAKWYVKDGSRLVSTGCGEGRSAAAKAILTAHVRAKAAALRGDVAGR
ncbi:hypothetical protein ABIF62_003151 [Bradyrhizobium japonicum]